LQSFGAGAGTLPAKWQLWTPKPGQGLTVVRVKTGVRMVGAAAEPQAKSRIFCTIEGLQPGQWYRFSATYSFAGIPNPSNAIMAVVQWKNFHEYRTMAPVIKGLDGSNSVVFQLPEETKGTVYMHLFAAYIPKGSVTWREVSVERIEGYKVPTRPITVATIDSTPPKEGPVEDNARHHAAEIDKAVAMKPPDIILLPENFNKSNVTGEALVSLDSKYMSILRDAARRNRVYLAGSIYDERGGNAYNSAILLDREGRTVGSHAKSHLTVGEMMFSPLARGDDWPVFQTDFGKVGVLVCFDFNYPEAARILRTHEGRRYASRRGIHRESIRAGESSAHPIRGDARLRRAALVDHRRTRQRARVKLELTAHHPGSLDLDEKTIQSEWQRLPIDVPRRPPARVVPTAWTRVDGCQTGWTMAGCSEGNSSDSCPWPPCDRARP
jgi:hypothetical protein